jgi:hypothetical protein
MRAPFEFLDSLFSITCRVASVAFGTTESRKSHACNFGPTGLDASLVSAVRIRLPSPRNAAPARAVLPGTSHAQSGLNTLIWHIDRICRQSSGRPFAGDDDGFAERSPIFLLADSIHRAQLPQQLVDQRAQPRPWRAVRE